MSFPVSKRHHRLVAGAALLSMLVSPVWMSPAYAQKQAQAQTLAPTAPPPQAPGSFADLAERLVPAVVNISTTQNLTSRSGDPRLPDMPQFPPGSPFEEFFREFFERQQQGEGGEAPAPKRATSLGSGFIIDPTGYVVTNNHVIQDADEITVILHDDTNLKAKLIGRDPKTDLALLKVETKHPLTAVPWGNSDEMRVGDWVLAIGNPFGLGGTVTAGIISARARDINAGPYDDFIQTDASINRGNSGGPMFNLNGQVIGVNTAIFSPTGGSVGIGFAIPSSLAHSVIDQLKDFGRTRRGWLGVRIQGVTPEIAESLGLQGDPRGALIASVTPEGPAAKAGMQAGDIVLTFNEHPVDEMRRLPRVVAETPIDQAVPVSVWRKGKEVALKVTVGELEAAEESGLVASDNGEEQKPVAPQTTELLGMTLTSITPELRTQHEIAEDVKGVMITGVKNDSAAADMDLQPGDVVVEVGQSEVTTPEDMKKKVDEAQGAGRKSVLLLVNRDGDLRFVALQVGKS